MSVSQGMCCRILSQPGQNIPALAQQREPGTAVGCRGDVRLMRGPMVGPDPVSTLLMLPFPSSTQPGWHMAGTQPAHPPACRIDQLNGELMAIAPLGQRSSSAAAIEKAEPGALGH